MRAILYVLIEDEEDVRRIIQESITKMQQIDGANWRHSSMFIWVISETELGHGAFLKAFAVRSKIEGNSFLKKYRIVWNIFLKIWKFWNVQRISFYSEKKLATTAVFMN